MLYPNTCNNCKHPKDNNSFFYFPHSPQSLTVILGPHILYCLTEQTKSICSQEKRLSWAPSTRAGNTQLSHTPVFKTWDYRQPPHFSLFLLFLYISHDLPIPSKVIYCTPESQWLTSILSAKVSIYFRSLTLNYFCQISPDELMSSQTTKTIMKYNIPYIQY